jgi:hypothetical protein
MNDQGHPTLAVDLYWSLPGPRRFKEELVQAIESKSVVVVRIDRSHITGVNWALRLALEAAMRDPERAEWIDLDDGVHLESAIGYHCGRATVSALELAHWSALPRVAIALTPKSERARQRCREYLEQFSAERESGAQGTVRLMVVWKSGDDALVPPATEMVAFNGALSADEMHAYVALRMIGRHAPGSTSLTRHLVTEFAGSDPVLAEALMALSPSSLLSMPDSLAEIAQQFSTTVSGVPFAPTDVGGADNVLLDWALSRTTGPAAAAAVKRLQRRYWRACVRSLLPWLEERRFPVIDKLRRTLEDYLYPQNAWRKYYANGRATDISIDDLEFNDIVAMTHTQQDPLKAHDEATERLIRACFQAKRVRDALAHMRAPSTEDVESAVRAIEDAL